MTFPFPFSRRDISSFPFSGLPISYPASAGFIGIWAGVSVPLEVSAARQAGRAQPRTHFASVRGVMLVRNHLVIWNLVKTMNVTEAYIFDILAAAGLMYW